MAMRPEPDSACPADEARLRWAHRVTRVAALLPRLLQLYWYLPIQLNMGLTFRMKLGDMLVMRRICLTNTRSLMGSCSSHGTRTTSWVLTAFSSTTTMP